MKKLFILPILAILLFGCSKKELIQVKGTIHGYVMDQNTGAFLNGVAVSFTQGSDSGSVVTDASGYYSISGIDAGEVSLFYNLSGYATYMRVSYIDELSDYEVVRGGGEVPYFEEENVGMVAIGATVEGVLMKEVGPYSDVRPAANYPVILYNNNSQDYGFLPAMFTTSTNARGEFSFTDLPVNTYMIIYFPSTADNDNYYEYASKYLNTPLSGAVEVRYTLNRSNLGIFITGSNLWETNGTYIQDYPVNEPIVLNFSQAVSKELTERDGYISLSGVMLDYDSDIEYSGSTITITPPIDLTNDMGFTLSFAVSSETPGDLYSGSIAFHTVE
jgi:hypothetical protein